MQKVVVSDPKSGNSYSIELDESKARIFLGKEIGKVLDASSIGLPGYKIQITGGSDSDGFPMRSDVHGRVRVKTLLSNGPGYRPREEGMRKRKRVRGRVITSEIVQINAKVVEAGKKAIGELTGTAEGKEEKSKEAVEVKKKEEKAEPPKEAAKKEKPAEKEAVKDEKPKQEKKPPEGKEEKSAEKKK